VNSAKLFALVRLRLGNTKVAVSGGQRPARLAHDRVEPYAGQVAYTVPYYQYPTTRAMFEASAGPRSSSEPWSDRWRTCLIRNETLLPDLGRPHERPLWAHFLPSKGRSPLTVSSQRSCCRPAMPH